MVLAHRWSTWICVFVPPDTMDDLEFAAGDKMVINGRTYRVQEVNFVTCSVKGVPHKISDWVLHVWDWYWGETFSVTQTDVR